MFDTKKTDIMSSTFAEIADEQIKNKNFPLGFIFKQPTMILES